MPRATRALSVLLRIVAGLVAVVVLVYLAVNGAAVLQAHERRGELEDQMTRRLERALPAAADRQQDVVARAGREPDERWIEQHCDFSSDDAGWIVRSYRETCSVRSLSAWRVESVEEATTLLAVDGDGLSAYGGCRGLGTVDDADAYLVDAAAADRHPWCTGADLGESRDLVGDRVALDAGRWLLVVDQQPLLDEAIGCVRWSVLFCGNPFGRRHAFGESPAR